MEMKKTTLKDIMTTRVSTIGMDATVEDMRNIFNRANFHHLIVIDENKIVGVISDRDLFRELSPFLNTAAEQNRDRETLKKKAHQIMTRKLQFADPTATVKNAAAMFVKYSISCLPVVTENKALAGIVTWKDILKHCLEN
jgi:acetoin utilization protein AcuB